MYAHPKEAVATFFSALFANQIPEAEELLESVRFEGCQGLRMREHYRAQIHMQVGEHVKAIELLLQAEARYGSYIGITVDLATCYYALGNIKLYRRCLHDIHAFVSNQDLRDQLQAPRLVRYACWLAEHLEDLGEIGPALNILDVLANECETRLGPECLAKLNIQRLKILSVFENGRAVADAYAALEKMSSALSNSRLRVDCEHALMVAEVQLFGPVHGEVRLLRLVNDREITQRERTCAIADFIYTSSIFHSPPDGIAMGLKAENPEGAFEHFIFSFNARGHLPLSEISYEMFQLSWAGQLRLLIIIAKTANQAEKLEIQKRIQLLLAGLDKKSKTYWLKLLETQLLHRDSPVTLEIRHRGDALYIDRYKLRTGPKETLVKLLEALSKSALHTDHPTDLICQALWGTPFDLSSLARLKMLAKRLNDELLETLGQRRFLKVTKACVSAQTPFKLVHAECERMG